MRLVAVASSARLYLRPCTLWPTLLCRGELYTWGLASSGELGQGGWTPIEVGVPRMITSLQRTRIVSVACGANHTLAISETGQLWSCGRGRHGQVRVAGRAGLCFLHLGLQACRPLPPAQFRPCTPAVLGASSPSDRAARPPPPPAAGPRPLPRRGAAAAGGHDPARARGVGGGWACTQRGAGGGRQDLHLGRRLARPAGPRAAGGHDAGAQPAAAVHPLPASHPEPGAGAAAPAGARHRHCRRRRPLHGCHRGRLPPSLRLQQAWPGAVHAVAGALYSWDHHWQPRLHAHIVKRACLPSCLLDPSSCPRLLPALHPCCLQLGTGDTLDRLVPTEVPLALESEAGQLVRAMQVQCGAQHTLALVQVQGESQVRSVGGNSYGELGLGDRQERHRFHPIPGLRVSGGKGWARSCRAGFSRVWWRQMTARLL